MNERTLILMQLQDFNRIKLRGGMKICFCFYSLRLERVETLKHRCVCRPAFGKVLYSN